MEKSSDFLSESTEETPHEATKEITTVLGSGDSYEKSLISKTQGSELTANFKFSDQVKFNSQAASKRKTSLNLKFSCQSAPKWSWKTHKGLLYGTHLNDRPSSKVALFDMDGTLIVNKNGRRVTDWEFFHASVPEKLRELKEDGFRIVIVSNQLGVSLNVVSASDLQKKVEDFTSVIGVEMSCMLATKNDKFRKPDTGMWHFVLNSLNALMVNHEQCVS